MTAPSTGPRPLENLSDADLQQRALRTPSEREAVITESLFRTRDALLLSQEMTNKLTAKVRTLTVWLVVLTVAIAVLTLVQAGAAWKNLTPSPLSAWVLWHDSMAKARNVREEKWGPIHSFTTQTECLGIVATIEKIIEKTPPGIPLPDTDGRYTPAYICLPDTIDPRGGENKMTVAEGQRTGAA